MTGAVPSVTINSAAAAVFPDGNPIVLGAVLLMLALVPFLALAMTSFLKLSVVFAILRNALGAGQIPSGAAASLLALVLTGYVMRPVASQTAVVFQEQLHAKGNLTPAAATRPLSGSKTRSRKPGPSKAEQLSQAEQQIAQLWTAAQAAGEPLRKFLIVHSRPRELCFFEKLSGDHTRESSSRKQSDAFAANALNAPDCQPPQEAGFAAAVPAFVLSELAGAFWTGFMLFLPFLIVDLVVSNTLVGLGMTMVSPITVSLPLKLLLFTACNGWFLICRGLVLGYR